MIGLRDIRESLLQILFPHICSGCGTDGISEGNTICIECLARLPETNFHLFPNNPVEKIFWGRLPLVHATAHFYFSKESLMQRLMHQVKYKGNRELARLLGRMMGEKIFQSSHFSEVDALVPLPLFPAREKKRGYNQATLLCEGIRSVTGLQIMTGVITRPQHTETQTKKGRIERWKNMEGKFELVGPSRIEGRHVLLVDDVITTGATLEACGLKLLEAADTRLSIAALCVASR